MYESQASLVARRGEVADPVGTPLTLEWRRTKQLSIDLTCLSFIDVQYLRFPYNTIIKIRKEQQRHNLSWQITACPLEYGKFSGHYIPTDTAFACSYSYLYIDREICSQPLLSIVQLLKTYSRFYSYAHLLVTLMHEAATATNVIMLKEWLSPDNGEETAAELDEMSRVVDALYSYVVSREANAGYDKGGKGHR
jgi:hypothetical protein